MESTLCLTEVAVTAKDLPEAGSGKGTWSIWATSKEEPPVPKQNMTEDASPLSALAAGKGACAWQRHGEVGRCLPALQGLPRIRADGCQIPSTARAHRLTAAGRGRFLPAAQLVSPA